MTRTRARTGPATEPLFDLADLLPPLVSQAVPQQHPHAPALGVYRPDPRGGITHTSEFSGGGGLTAGADAVPYVETVTACNHNSDAIATHRLNFPNAEHRQADITKLPMEDLPHTDMDSYAPVCPPWTKANGMRRDFDKVNSRQTLSGEDAEDEDEDDPKVKKRKEGYKRARLLMNQVVRRLRHQSERGTPVLIGFVENVPQCRLWSEWDRWVGEIRLLGYKVRLIALNSMHARPVRTAWSASSRNRLYLAFWHESLGRDPDWDKWLRPKAYCTGCEQIIDGVQVFKQPGVDMGDYGPQYVYRCPTIACRFAEVFPETVPAMAIIDPTIKGVRIGDRAAHGLPELVPATLQRIINGARHLWLPMLGSTGMPAVPGDSPVMPFITPLRGGGDKGRWRKVTNPLTTVTASGNHHGLATPPATVADADDLSDWVRRTMLVPYYGSADKGHTLTAPIGTLTTRDRYGVARVDDFGMWERGMSDERIAKLVQDMRFRMVSPEEAALAMAFDPMFKFNTTTKAVRMRLIGNAVTPPASEVITSALVECLTGETFERDALMLAA